jgi:TPR repeat protein
MARCFGSNNHRGGLPWGEKPSATGRDYAALAARLTEIEKRPVSPSFDLEAIKSAENALARRVDKLEVAVSHLQEQSVAQQPKALAAPAPLAAGPRLPTEEIAEILGHGDALLRTGDVASARLFYERAAGGGDGRAALRLGATFDPAFLDRDVLRGVRGDLAEAHIWYQRARDAGEAEAERRLKSLETKEREKSP